MLAEFGGYVTSLQGALVQNIASASTEKVPVTLNCARRAFFLDHFVRIIP